MSGVNNTNYGIGTTISSGSNNTSIGAYSSPINSGNQNVAVGTNTLLYNTTGSYNTALGTAALCFNTAGISNTSVGASSTEFTATNTSYNTAIGTQALFTDYGIGSNTAVGTYAGKISLTGSYGNTYIGINSCSDGKTGYTGSTALGYNSVITKSNQIVLGTSAETIYFSGTDVSGISIGVTGPTGYIKFSSGSIQTTPYPGPIISNITPTPVTNTYMQIKSSSGIYYVPLYQ
jgi:hypothetical protein